ncbi:nucleocapsid [Rhinolophus rhabdovirus DPuer]|nr:nucleocapsid [Rhinolophus rhabdovirus DPuer]
MAEKEKAVVYHLSSRKPVKFTLPQEETPPEYASKWFELNKGKKPPLKVGLKKVDTKDLFQTVAEALATGTLTGEMAVAALYRYFKSDNQICIGDWTSFGIEIGKNNTKICPWALVEVEEYESELPNMPKRDVTEKDYDWIVFYICFLYRYSRANHTDYRDQLYCRGQEHVKNINAKVQHVQPGMLMLMKNIIYYHFYNVAIAAIDMFYYKFKVAENAQMRYGTLSSRYKDCSALTTLNHITQVTGLPIERFILWVFSERMATEVAQMAKEGEELERCDSYTAYMREMGISVKSPYSSQANPSFALFCHVVGAILGSKRSKNARMGAEVDTVNSLLNGKVVAYVLGTRPDFVQAYVAELPKNVPTADDDDEAVEAGSVPLSADPEEWFAYLSSRGFQLPDAVERWVKARVLAMTDVRDGTVGKFLKSQV